MFRPVDLLTIPGMMGVALIFTQQFQAGRLLMHAAPLFVLPFVAGLSAFSGTPEGQASGESIRAGRTGALT
jgi:hypothetical protein